MPSPNLPIERKTLEESLRQSEEWFRLLVTSVKDYAIFLLDENGYIASWNAGAERAKGYKPEEIIGRHFSVFYTPEDRARSRPQDLLQVAIQMGRVEDEGWRVRKDGTRFWADVILTPIYDDSKRLRGFAKVTRDLTERRKTELQLRDKQDEINKLQKIESIGRLAGGIAHDFNNLVAGILGCAEAMSDMTTSKDVLEEAAQIKQACVRAHALVRQLMAFSRRQVALPQSVQINTIIEDTTQLIRRSIPSNIQITFNLEPGLPHIHADTSQIEQIIMNLVLNARDAMPEGGSLSLRTARCWVDEFTVIDGFPKRPAEAVLLSIADSGVGMSKAIQEKIFEPFFTTKEVGKGTGLGLATVYGIVQQNEGGIAVYSSPGVGTTLKIFLPVLGPGDPDPVKPVPQTDPQRAGSKESELILVVEDEPLVLRNTVRALQKLGYTVLSATNSEEAIQLFEKTQGKIDLLITDIIMPGKSGKELAEILHQKDAHLSILFMSGYSAETVATHGLLTSEINFLEKPFSTNVLADKIRSILDRRTH